jgi:hypothetical protein
MFRQLRKTIGQIPFQLGTTLTSQPVIPNDKLIMGLSFTISMPVAITTPAASMQNAFAPAIAQVLGLLTINGTKPLDGSAGLFIKQIPFSQLFLRTQLLTQATPQNTDLILNTGTGNTGFFSLFVPFFDPKLPRSQQLLQYLDPARYGQLTIKIDSGNLYAASGDSDQVGAVGTAATAALVGSPLLSVSVVQADIDAGQKLPSIDLSLEYQRLPALTAAGQSNGVQLVTREIQSRTYMTFANRSAAKLETAANTLFYNSEIVNRWGATRKLDDFGSNIQTDEGQDYIAAGQSAMPVGSVVLDYQNHNLKTAIDLQATTNAINYLDTNIAATGGTDSIQRILHETYNKSAIAQKSMGL